MLSLHVHKMSLTIWLLTKESLKCNNNNNKTWCSNDMSVNIYSHWIIMNSLWTGERGSWTAAKRTIEFVFDPDFFSIHFSLCRVVSISRLNGMLAECYQFACRDGRQQSPCFSTLEKKMNSFWPFITFILIVFYSLVKRRYSERMNDTINDCDRPLCPCTLPYSHPEQATNKPTKKVEENLFDEIKTFIGS